MGGAGAKDSPPDAVSINPFASPRDVFLHLLVFVALYASAISLVVLLYQLANVYIPDPLERSQTQYAYSLIRGAISWLVIFFPVFVATSWYLERLYEERPERRALAIRRWSIYCTLFFAVLVMCFFLRGIINSFLDGELTLRFATKTVSAFLVSGSVFAYYFWDLRRGGEE